MMSATGKELATMVQQLDGRRRLAFRRLVTATKRLHPLMGKVIVASFRRSYFAYGITRDFERGDRLDRVHTIIFKDCMSEIGVYGKWERAVLQEDVVGLSFLQRADTWALGSTFDILLTELPVKTLHHIACGILKHRDDFFDKSEESGHLTSSGKDLSIAVVQYTASITSDDLEGATAALKEVCKLSMGLLLLRAPGAKERIKDAAGAAARTYNDQDLPDYEDVVAEETADLAHTALEGAMHQQVLASNIVELNMQQVQELHGFAATSQQILDEVLQHTMRGLALAEGPVA